MQLAGVRAKARQLLQGDAAVGKRCMVSERFGLPTEHPTGKRVQGSAVCGSAPRLASRFVFHVTLTLALALALALALTLALTPTPTLPNPNPLTPTLTLPTIITDPP